ncbi:hypothetical protein LG52_586 [Geobacillus kaustophilus]|uniref:Uncharacterized protein n=1 Tax=Geobacillus kaustophilus TaxID=1462 RepID=A0A0D8BXS1_GEOKU|nr:hypothetical protein LG52_586 [Geobacillus kaustophilus]
MKKEFQIKLDNDFPVFVHTNYKDGRNGGKR